MVDGGFHLVTTADQKTWDENKKTLFLGGWCKRFSQRHIWGKMDHETVPYHWDAREKFYRDYEMLQALHEEVLEVLSKDFNTLHNTQHSIRYWRILLGPWLLYFIPIIYDRWESITNAIKYGSLESVTFNLYDDEAYTANDTATFLPLVRGDEWNQWIFSKIIQYRSEECNIIPSQLAKQPKKKPKKSFKSIIKLFFKFLISTFSRWLSKDDDVFMISSYFDLINQIKLQRKLNQFPAIWYSNLLKSFAYDKPKREKLGQSICSGDDFKLFLTNVISTQIPKVFVEGYEKTVGTANSGKWPTNPKIIFTSNNFIADDYFKVWCAHHVDKGVKLVIGQHGGSYGISDKYTVEVHELSIADHYADWGWGKNAPNSNLPASKLINLTSLKPDSTGSLLLVTATLPRYSQFIAGFPNGPQYEHYFNDQFRFIKTLLAPIKKSTTVRLYHHDYGWDQKERWLENIPDIKFDSPNRSMLDSLKKSRLFIGTYNATTFLETFAADFPTIMFWDPNYWEVRPDAEADYELLKHVGILHDTPESAALKVNEIWDDVEGWWQSNDIQEVRKAFSYKYARTSDNWLEKWVDFFQRIMDE